MNIYMTPRAFWHVQWMAHRTENEVSSIGVLSLENRGFTVADVVLVKQEVSAAHVNLDMDWWAEKQIELFEMRGMALRAVAAVTSRGSARAAFTRIPPASSGLPRPTRRPCASPPQADSGRGT